MISFNSISAAKSLLEYSKTAETNYLRYLNHLVGLNNYLKIGLRIIVEQFATVGRGSYFIPHIFICTENTVESLCNLRVIPRVMQDR